MAELEGGGSRTTDEDLAALASLRLPERFAVFAGGPGELRVQSSSRNLRLSGLDDPAAFLDVLRGLRAHSASTVLAPLPPSTREEAVQTLLLLAREGVLEEAAHPAHDAAGEPGARQQLFFEQFQRGVGTPSAFTAASARARLGAATVSVLGLGLVGSQVARSLALTGVARLRLGDSKVLTEADSRAGGWYGSGQTGNTRAEAVATAVRGVQPEVETCLLAGFEDEPAASLAARLGGSQLVVLAPETYRSGLFHTVNEACRRAAIPWVGRRALGLVVSIGPFVLPGESPCWLCFEHRLHANLLDVEERHLLEAYLEEAELPTGEIPVAVGAEALTLEALRFITNFQPPQTIGSVLFLGAGGGSVRLRPLLRIPRCPGCAVVGPRGR
jgi:bacteriocin biosynthesis cyclodehydratase domain-containing protein